MILRLNNDLGTSSYELARGDNLKALECYLNETGASKEVVRGHIENLVRETWKRMNKDAFDDYPFSGLEPFLGACLNFARASQCFYQYGDGHAEDVPTDFMLSRANDPNPYTFPFFTAADACHQLLLLLGCDISIARRRPFCTLAAATTPDTRP
ncbi:hypothetical protein NL676_003833 [Syzygium grande]|nr:hypothetical protein NL676_003833 [Syzygium grande]